MFSLKLAISTFFAFLAVGQSQQFQIQNWGNGQPTTNYTYTNLAAGRFKVDWILGAGGNFVAGKGYRGSQNLFVDLPNPPHHAQADHYTRVVNYTAIYNPTGNSYLALYGFSNNPFVEFYVVEAFAAHNPSDNAGHSFYGYHNSDGAQYELWSKYNGNLRQYFSVRRTNRRGGTITFNNHYRAWAAAGLPLGSLGNTFIVVEGQQGRGNADVTVGVRPTTSIRETATPTTRSLVCVTSSHTIGTICKPRATKRDETATLVKVARAEAVPTA